MTKRILTIDGGGLRGVFAAAIIERMEEVNQQPAHELFDCFCGTSAGALLAAGLAAGKTAGTMKRLFIKLGENMAALMAAGGNGNGSAHGGREAREQASKALEEMLKSEALFGETLLPSQLKRRLAIPARNMERGQVVFFGNFPADQVDGPSFWDDRDVDENEPVWQIVRRSTALPPLFTPAGPYLDGGVSPFANPTYAAYEGVQRRLGWNPYRERLRFYSVGTGYHRYRVADIGALDDTALYDSMVDAMMQDINFLQHQVMKRRSGEGTIWYRRYNISFDRKGFERFGMPVPSERHLRELASTATPFVGELAEIGSRVAEQSVDSHDFSDLAPLADRRKAADRRSGGDRRTRPSRNVAAGVTDRRSSLQRRRHNRRVLSGVVACSSTPTRAVDGAA